METRRFVKTNVARHYWDEDLNCAVTTLKILSKVFSLPLDKQVIDAATALPGAGQYGAQCGLVSGAIMFMGILGRERGASDDTIVKACHAFSERFESEFKSHLCRILRPEGFHPDNPPHLCEPLTCKAIEMSIGIVSSLRETRIAPEGDAPCPLNKSPTNPNSH